MKREEAIRRIKECLDKKTWLINEEDMNVLFMLILELAENERTWDEFREGMVAFVCEWEHTTDFERKSVVDKWYSKLLDLACKKCHNVEDVTAFVKGFKTAKELYSPELRKNFFSKRLPTIDEWKWLIYNCQWKWDNVRKGQIVIAPNGNSIFLPAAGYRSGTSLYSVDSKGYYWSSSLNMNSSSLVYNMGFYSDGVWIGSGRWLGFSVRFVSNTSQEGFIDMGNNLYWAKENMGELYDYNEVMKLYNNRH